MVEGFLADFPDIFKDNMEKYGPSNAIIGEKFLWSFGSSHEYEGLQLHQFFFSFLIFWTEKKSQIFKSRSQGIPGKIMEKKLPFTHTLVNTFLIILTQT